jgi:hypothetical protein
VRLHIDGCSSVERRQSERRRFFDEFAHSKKFDPLDAEKWYSVTYTQIINSVCYLIWFWRVQLTYFKREGKEYLMELYSNL